MKSKNTKPSTDTPIRVFAAVCFLLLVLLLLYAEYWRM